WPQGSASRAGKPSLRTGNFSRGRTTVREPDNERSSACSPADETHSLRDLDLVRAARPRNARPSTGPSCCWSERAIYKVIWENHSSSAPSIQSIGPFSVPLRLAWLLAVDYSEPYRIGERLVLAGKAEDPSPPVP